LYCIKCYNGTGVGSGGGQAVSQAGGYCSAGAVAANTHSHQQSRGPTAQQQAYTGSPGYAQTLPASSGQYHHQHRQQQQTAAGSPQSVTLVNGQVDCTDNDLR